MKAAIYARVSTKDKGQDVANQLVELRRYALTQHWEVVEFIDHETGKHAGREGFQNLFAAASRREFGIVLVWALDRFTREGVAETFLHIKTLLGYGVQFESFTEAHFRTTGPAGELMIAIAAWIAKQERQRISDRTKAGMARVKAEGKQLGRPLIIYRRDHAIEMRAAGMSWRKMAVQLGVGQSTLRADFKRASKCASKASSKPAKKRGK